MMINQKFAMMEKLLNTFLDEGVELEELEELKELFNNTVDVFVDAIKDEAGVI